MKKSKVLFVVLALLAIGSLTLGACKSNPLGSEANPIIWAVVPSGETSRVVAGFDSVAQLIFNETGLYIKPFVATEYAGVIEALCANPPKAQMASLATFSYLLANSKGCAEAELVSVRYGLPYYTGQLITRVDSGITSVADLAGKTFCRPDPLSTSGWIIPSIMMKAAGVDPDAGGLAQIVDAGSHDAVVAGVYNGDCDAGATYVDARATVEEDYPDVMDVVTVFAVSPEIPNDGVQYQTSVSRETRDKINNALLSIAQTEEGQAALDEAYQWTDLQKIDNSFYDAFRQILDAAGVSPEQLAQ